MSDLGNIIKVIPSDTAVLMPFSYLQVGVSGDVAIEAINGTQTIISAELTDRMGIVPVGVHSKVLSTGTTATDIYVWG
jgi:hypothetical protein